MLRLTYPDGIGIGGSSSCEIKTHEEFTNECRIIDSENAILVSGVFDNSDWDKQFSLKVSGTTPS